MATSVVLTRPLASPASASSGNPDGLSVESVDGQPILMMRDTTRNNKKLSIAEQTLVFSKNQVNNMDWLRIGNSINSLTGYISEHDGTIVTATAYCSNVKDKDYWFSVYINDVDSGQLINLKGAGDDSFVSTGVDIDFQLEDKIRIRSWFLEDSGSINDVVIKLIIKHRKIE